MSLVLETGDFFYCAGIGSLYIMSLIKTCCGAITMGVRGCNGDVMQIWKHTSFGCSLDLLSMTLLGESPKSEGTGEYVASALLANNFDWIEKYCEGDVLYAEKCYEYIMNPEEIEIKKQEKSAKEIAEAKMAEPIE